MEQSNLEESGTYTYETVNSNVSDSVATLSLTIINSNSTTESFTSCEAFTWDNGITYTESNNLIFTLSMDQTLCVEIRFF